MIMRDENNIRLIGIINTERIDVDNLFTVVDFNSGLPEPFDRTCKCYNLFFRNLLSYQSGH